jgi:hypothetical protein
MFHQRLKEITTSPNVQIRPFLLLDPGDLFGNIPVQKHGRLPFAGSHGIRSDVLGRGVDAGPYVRMQRPVGRPNVKGLAPYQQVERHVHLLLQSRARMSSHMALTTRRTRSRRWDLHPARLAPG